MIEKLSNSISSYLCRELSYSDEKEEVLSYGLQIFLGTGLKLLTIVILSYILDIFKSTIVVSFSFILFRRIIGGGHSDTYNKCYFLSVSLMLLLGLLGELLILSYHLLLISVITVYLASIAVTIMWVPMGTEKKAIKNKKTRLKIKRKTFYILTAWLLILLYLQAIALSDIVLSSLLGISLAFFLATPLGNKFTNIKISYREEGDAC